MKHARPGLALSLAALLLASCGWSGGGTGSGDEVGHYKLGRPYRIGGRWYRPEYDPGYDRVGTASWYGRDFQGLPTANGEVFDRHEVTAAHPTLPLPSIVRVTNLENGRSLTLRVNDRGPFARGRLIDLSQAAARKLGYEKQGLARVRVTFLKLARDATGTPPRPTVAAADRAPAAAAPRAPRALAAAPAAPVRVAALAPSSAPAAAAAIGACARGPHFVQVGAFAETDTMRAAMETAAELRPGVRVEPTFVGDRAVARVRLGPVAGVAEAQALLRQVQARGYPGAFLAPAGGGATASC